jgi:hypothetical protein
MNPIIMTSLKHKVKMGRMIHSLMRVSSQIIEIGLDDVFKVMERE